MKKFIKGALADQKKFLLKLSTVCILKYLKLHSIVMLPIMKFLVDNIEVKQDTFFEELQKLFCVNYKTYDSKSLDDDNILHLSNGLKNVIFSADATDAEVDASIKNVIQAIEMSKKDWEKKTYPIDNEKPYGGPIDIYAVIAKTHDFINKNKYKRGPEEKNKVKEVQEVVENKNSTLLDDDRLVITLDEKINKQAKSKKDKAFGDVWKMKMGEVEQPVKKKSPRNKGKKL